MFRKYTIVLAVGLAVGACSTSKGESTSPGGGSETLDVDAAIRSACNQPTRYCDQAAGCADGRFCPPQALPTGLACGDGGPALSCGMGIDPCPGWQLYAGKERVDAYACTCIDGKWACGLCVKGGSFCNPYDGGTD